MAVELDTPCAWSPTAGYGPMWKVRCDNPVCYRRLYLFAADGDGAAKRAEAEYGWLRAGARMFCDVHRRLEEEGR